jgi:hypothetical protein
MASHHYRLTVTEEASYPKSVIHELPIDSPANWESIPLQATAGVDKLSSSFPQAPCVNL